MISYAFFSSRTATTTALPDYARPGEIADRNSQTQRHVVGAYLPDLRRFGGVLVFPLPPEFR